MADSTKTFFLQFVQKKAGLDKISKSLKQLNAVNKRVSKDIPQAVRIMNTQVSRQLNQQGKVITNLSVMWRSASGKIHSSVIKMNNSNKMLSASVKKATGAFGGFNKGIGGIVKRALQTIPVWLALRGSVMGVMNTIRNGTKYWLDFEKELLRIKSVLFGMTEGLDTTMEMIERRITSLSRETGESMADIGNAFYRFKTIGNDVETSMAGMEGAVKGAMSMLDDSKEAALTMARSYRMLGHTTDQTIPITERMEAQWAKIYKLYQTNDFYLNEFRESMGKFLGTAASLNLSLDFTTALLSTLNSAQVRAASAGTLSTTAFFKMSQNLTKVAGDLGLNVNPQLESMEQIFMRILKVAADARSQGDIEKVGKVFTSIFGGTKGGKIVAGLTAMYKGFLKNIDITKMTGEELENIKGLYNEWLAVVKSSVPQQTKIMKNNFDLIGKGFVESALGGENFAKTLETKVNPMLRDLEMSAKLAGRGINNLYEVLVMASNFVFTGSAFETMEKKFKAGQATYEELIILHKKYSNLTTKPTSHLMDDIKMLRLLEKELIRIGSEKALTEKGAKKAKELGITVKPKLDPESLKQIEKDVLNMENRINEKRKTISTSTQKQLNLMQQGLEYLQLQNQGVGAIEISYEKLTNYINELVKEYQKLGDSEEARLNLITTEQITTLALQGNYEQILNLMSNVLDEEKELAKIKQLVLNIEKEKLKITEKYNKQIKGVLKGTFSEVLSSGDLNSFLDTLGSKLRETMIENISEGLTQSIFKMTDIGSIWGDMAGQWGEMGSAIQTSSATGSQMFFNAIVEASNISAPKFASTTKVDKGGGVPAAAGIGGTVASMLGVGSMGKISESKRSLAPTTSTGQGGFWADKGNKPFTMGGGLMTVAGGAMMNQGRGGAAMAMSGIGAGLMSFGGPIGFAVGGLMTLASLFMGKKKSEVKETSTWKPEEVRSMAPYMGMDIAPVPQMYALRKCFDDKTEILTDDGFKFFKDLTYKDKVMSMNLNNQYSDYYPIQEIIKEYYEGKMLKIENKYVDFCITPNHNIFCNTTESGNWREGKRGWQLKEIQNIFDTKNLEYKIKFKKTIKWRSFKGKNKYTYRKYYYPTKEDGRFYWTKGKSRKKIKYNLKLWLKLIGWYVSEGSIESSRVFMIPQKKYKEEVRQILIDMKLDFWEKPQKDGCIHFKVRNEYMKNFLQKECGDKSFKKKVPKFIKVLSPTQIRFFLDGYGKGDGYKDPLYKGEEWEYYTISKQLADDVQELVIKTGGYTNIRKDKDSYKYNIREYCMIGSKRRRRVLRRSCVSISQIKEIEYKGFIYCVDVEPFHVIYVRRNGCCHWSGNSSYFGRSGPIQVNIKIDKITGADETIAETISEKVSIGLTKVLPKEYSRGINRGEMSQRLLF